MLTDSKLRSQVNAIWNKLHSGGLPNPLDSIEQLSYDLGAYTSIGVYSEYSMPFDYAADCENALEVFDSAVSWDELKELYEKQFSDVDEDEEADDELE
ncbi:MAG: hypothetical protein LC778_14620 [Acidobacteria bacterium]|nr:hypothetical protein [Acidobacteriota bacterium]